VVDDSLYPVREDGERTPSQPPSSPAAFTTFTSTQAREPLRILKFKIVTAGSAVGEFTKFNISLNGPENGALFVSVIRFGSGTFKHPAMRLPVTYLTTISNASASDSMLGSRMTYAAEYKISPFDAGFQLFVQVIIGKDPHFYKLTDNVVGMDLSFYQISKRMARKRWKFHGTVHDSDSVTVQRAGKEILVKFGKAIQARAPVTECYAKEYPEKNILKVHVGEAAFLIAMSSITEVQECYVGIMMNSPAPMKSYTDLIAECQ